MERMKWGWAGWLVVGAMVVAAGPQAAQAKAKKKATAVPKAEAAPAKAAPKQPAATSDLEGRVRALEKKTEAEQKTTAEDHKKIQQRSNALEKEVREVQKTITEKLGVDIHGLVAGSYLYNTNRPANSQNALRVFDTDHNTFTLDQANLRFSRTNKDNFGFVISMDFGKVAEVVGSSTLWSRGGNSESTNSFELREAFLTYKVPVGDGITLKAGKFVTLLGAEIIPNYDNLNANVSRSFSFGYGIPFTHTGITASFPLGPYVNIEAGVVNGWENVVDNNDGKSFLGGVSINPMDMLSIYVSSIYGPERDGPGAGASKRSSNTAVFTIKPIDMLTLMVEGTYGNETDPVKTLADTTKTADWYGGAGYVIVKATDDLSFAFRGEVFDDSDNSRFSVAGVNSVTVWSLTPTIAYRIVDGLTWRTEYRHDEADKLAFNHDGNPVHGQDTIATQLVYAF